MIAYTIEYKKVKNITLRIRPDGSLCVTAPQYAKKADVEAVIVKKMNWITDHQQKMALLKQQRMQNGLVNRYCDGGNIAYLGTMYPLSVAETGKREWRWTGKSLFFGGCCTEEQCRQMAEKFYRTQMLEELIPRLNQAIRQDIAWLQLPEPEFSVRKMRSSWGICYSQKRKIVLNLWLAMAPEEAIRQVMLHEYVHFIHNNHSSEFYALLEQLEPQYRQIKHKLSVMVDIEGGTL